MSDWNKYKHSLVTQKILLDAITAHHGILGFDYPEYISDELWKLLGNILEGQTGLHITSAVQQLTVRQSEGHMYGEPGRRWSSPGCVHRVCRNQAFPGL